MGWHGTEMKLSVISFLFTVSISTINGSLLTLKAAGDDRVLAAQQTFGVYNKNSTNPDLENGIYLFYYIVLVSLSCY